MINILSVDDHPLFGHGLKAALETYNNDFSITTITQPEQAILCLSGSINFDLLLLDMNMPNIDGLSFLLALKTRKLFIPTIILSANESIETLQEALELGVLGIISKNSNITEISSDIRRVMLGEMVIPNNIYKSLQAISKYSQENTQTILSERQIEVLKLLKSGLTNEKIGEVLFISEYTVKSHLRTIFKILGAKSRVECIIKAKDMKIL